jgi:hypothetical protein
MGSTADERDREAGLEGGAVAGGAARARRGLALGGARGHAGPGLREGLHRCAGGDRAAATLQEIVGLRRRRGAAEETALLASRTQVA